MKISLITDEITQNFDEALAFAGQNGLDGLEFRTVEERPIDEIPSESLRSYKKRLDAAGLCVPCLAGSFYKCAAGRGPVLTKELEKLDRLCDAADILGCRNVRGFAFFVPDQGRMAPDEIAPYFKTPIELLKKRGKRLLLEADPSVNTTNHRSLAALLKVLDSPYLEAIYDPGNSLYDEYNENPYPDGYESIRPYLAHIHVKDVVYGPAGMPVCVKPGDGLVGYSELLRRLRKDGYSGFLSLETHYRKDVSLTREQMRLPGGGLFSAGGMEAARESLEALRTLLEEGEPDLWRRES